MNYVIPDLWILVTLAAAVFQTGRFMLQKYLATATLSAAALPSSAMSKVSLPLAPLAKGLRWSRRLPPRRAIVMIRERATSPGDATTWREHPFVRN